MRPRGQHWAQLCLKSSLVICFMGQSAPSTSLHVTQSCPAKGHRSNWVAGAPLLWSQPEGAETAQSAGEESQGYHISVYKYLKGECGEDGVRVFSPVPSARTMDSGHTLEQRRFLLNDGKHCCAVQVVEHWHRLSREVVGFPPRRSQESTWTQSCLPCPVCSCWNRGWAGWTMPTSTTFIL